MRGVGYMTILDVCATFLDERHDGETVGCNAVALHRILVETARKSGSPYCGQPFRLSPRQFVGGQGGAMPKGIAPYLLIARNSGCWTAPGMGGVAGNIWISHLCSFLPIWLIQFASLNKIPGLCFRRSGLLPTISDSL